MIFVHEIYFLLHFFKKLYQSHYNVVNLEHNVIYQEEGNKEPEHVGRWKKVWLAVSKKTRFRFNRGNGGSVGGQDKKTKQ